MIKKILPYPVLALLIVIMWLLLSGFSPGQLLLGCVVSLFAMFAAEKVGLLHEKIYSWSAFFKLLLRVSVDITRSNLAVAGIILRKGHTRYNSGFIVVPLDIRHRAGLVFLGGILTATPGTAWIAFNVKSNELVLHVLDLTDEAYWQQLIKNRYERLLMEMFE
ncbi:MAG: Monovalent cation/H+ antiporter subunit E [Candidatus Tokpelaia hoelldobleri]|uniref:Monovalent cation/H+ antiporter subunit E n=1 Tax=Candidatus Tokpelaia hoelldobleri TaxID=1902579 RepID=A0A1U9JSE9_9HYPH|nr:MAG: Monovalent cation/H+ antiporter subunit E [Candidatus Tokpelaia hoelldoblerii]